MSAIFKKEKEGLLFLLVLVTILSLVASSLFIDRLCVLVISFVTIRLGMKESTPLNPFFLFVITPLSLLVYYNAGQWYMLDLNHNTWFLAIYNMVAFLVALSLTTPVKKKKIHYSSGDNEHLALHTILLLFLASLESVIPQLASLLWILAIPAFECAAKSKSVFLFILIVAYIVFSFSLGLLSKMYVLMIIMAFLISYDKYYVVSNRDKKRVFFLIAVGMVLMINSFSFANKERGHYDADEGLDYYMEQGITWEGTSRLFLPYMYLTTSWTNLQYVIETQNTRTDGLWFAKPVLGYIQVDDKFKTDYTLIPYSTFNTFGFITCGFKDFGYWLSIISAIFLGFFVKKVYSLFLVSNSPFDVACYVLVALATLEMFFSNHFFMLSYPFTVVIEMWFYKIFANLISAIRRN